MTIDLRYGDTIEQMKLIPDKSIDFICCDLPYGSTKNHWDSIIPFKDLWQQYQRIIKFNGAIVLFSSQPFTSQLVMSNLKLFKYEWIWMKKNPKGFLNAKKMPLKNVENILVFYENLPTYNPQGLIRIDRKRTNDKSKNGINETGISSHNGGKMNGDYVQEFSNYPTQILYFGSEQGLHPSQKPLSLMEYLINTYTIEGELILDNTFGSCTTGIACINTNRNFIGIENNMDYFNISLKRVEEKRKEKEFNVVTTFGDGM